MAPGHQFAIQYLWRGSIFDGIEGIRISWQAALQRFCTHAFLRDLQQGSRQLDEVEEVDPKTIDLLDPTFRRAACEVQRPTLRMKFDGWGDALGFGRLPRCFYQEPILNLRRKILTRRVSEGIRGSVPRSRFGL